MSENKLNKFGAEFLLKSINPNGKSVEEEREEAVKHVFLRHYGVEEPARWVDVVDAYMKYYQKWKNALLKVSGGYENIKRKKELPADPFETYSKISMELKKPVEICFQIKDHDAVEVNELEIPLFIDGKAYTPFTEF